MEQEKDIEQSRSRKPFRNPRLEIYGHISALTQGSEVHGNADHNMLRSSLTGP
jgi:hypothetical protein